MGRIASVAECRKTCCSCPLVGRVEPSAARRALIDNKRRSLAAGGYGKRYYTDRQENPYAVSRISPPQSDWASSTSMCAPPRRCSVDPTGDFDALSCPCATPVPLPPFVLRLFPPINALPSARRRTDE
uniref:Uncharacterized protein n=1 Tax=Plectus sambesii TaxID=2011161 RepID=A0A914W343_9BILA